MRSQTRWSNACKAELQAQMRGLVAGRVQFLLFYTKISLETISVGPNFREDHVPTPPRRIMPCSTTHQIKGKMLPMVLD